MDRILVVEDDGSVREELTLLFSYLGEGGGQVIEDETCDLIHVTVL